MRTAAFSPRAPITRIQASSRPFRSATDSTERLGGHVGNGRQWVSWIHEKDFIRSVRWLINHDEIDGVVNLAAPYPVPNRDFMRAIREACGIRIGIPGPKPLLEIAAFIHRSETELLLKSRYV